MINKIKTGTLLLLISSFTYLNALDTLNDYKYTASISTVGVNVSKKINDFRYKAHINSYMQLFSISQAFKKSKETNFYYDIGFGLYAMKHPTFFAGIGYEYDMRYIDDIKDILQDKPIKVYVQVNINYVKIYQRVYHNTVYQQNLISPQLFVGIKYYFDK